LTVSELKVRRDEGRIQPISRSVVSVDSPHLTQRSIESMKLTAELREKETTNH
jgi:hypothetical protein